MVQPNPAVFHQSLQPQLKLDAPFTDASGRLVPPWTRLILYLWQQAGAGRIPQVSGLQIDFSTGIPQLVNNQGQVVGTISVSDFNVVEINNQFFLADSHGNILGQLLFTNSVGPTEQVINVGSTSPFVYSPIVSGTLVVNKGELELSRASGPFYVVSVMGGSVRLLSGDHARVSWMTSDKANVIWFPD